jgi:hypothetical protein
MLERRLVLWRRETSDNSLRTKTIGPLAFTCRGIPIDFNTSLEANPLQTPLREPFNLYVQGGTHRAHVELALIRALCALLKAGWVDLAQTG